MKMTHEEKLFERWCNGIIQGNQEMLRDKEIIAFIGDFKPRTQRQKGLYTDVSLLLIASYTDLVVFYFA